MGRECKERERRGRWERGERQSGERVCVKRERERKTERERDTERDGNRGREKSVTRIPPKLTDLKHLFVEKQVGETS